MHWFSHRHSRHQRALPSPRHPSATMQWYCLLLLAASGLQCTPYYALSMGMTRKFFLFLSLVTLTFKLGRDFRTVHITAKFHHPMFNRLEVIVLTNEKTNTWCWKHPLHSAMLHKWVNIYCTWKSSNYHPQKVHLSCRRQIMKKIQATYPERFLPGTS